jgi:hypothetical protein
MYKAAIVICKDIFLYNNLFTHAYKVGTHRGDKKQTNKENSGGF